MRRTRESSARKEYFLNVKSILRKKGMGGNSFELRTHCVVSCKRLTKQKKRKKKAWNTARTFDTWEVTMGGG